MGYLDEISYKIGQIDTAIRDIRSDIIHIKKKLNQKTPGRGILYILSAILVGIFSWLGVLTAAMLHK